jgi:hypothetical protein
MQYALTAVFSSVEGFARRRPARAASNAACNFSFVMTASFDQLEW